MREAADREDRGEKAAITPGPLAPARELLGDMLLERGEPARALEEFEAALKDEPNRFRTLYGAMRAARLARRSNLATRYARQLLRVCECADSTGRPELAQAKQLSSS
jgi:hypothetical protein